MQEECDDYLKKKNKFDEEIKYINEAIDTV
jgi:hypothetical protein